jgi:hypothetical protein
VNVVATVRVFPPTEVDVQCVRVVEFVVALDCPPDVEATGIGIAEAVFESYFESGGIEEIV